METQQWLGSAFNMAYFHDVTSGVWTPHKPIIHDATLRGAEYTFNRPFSVQEKVLIARKLDEIGIHMIEAGSPAVSDEEKEAAKALLSQGFKSQISGSVRTVRADLDAAISCGLKNVIMTIPLSLSGLATMRLSKEELLKRIKENVEYGSDHGIKVIVSGTDIGRVELDFIKEFAEVVMEAGGERIRFSDTTGSLNMFGMVYLLREVKKTVDGSRLAVRCHNNVGLATANTLAAFSEGVQELSVTAMGLGDRSGSASLEEVLLGLLVLFDCDFGFQYQELYELGRLIQDIVGFDITPTKPIIGDNCFNIIVGSQINMVKDDPLSCSPFLPEVVGQKMKISLGAFSGAAAIKIKLKELGIPVKGDKIPSVVKKVKELAIQKREGVSDGDLKRIASEV